MILSHSGILIVPSQFQDAQIVKWEKVEVPGKKHGSAVGE